MRVQKQQCVIHAIALLVYKIKEFWTEKKLATALFMDIKRAYNHVSKTKLYKKMMKLGIDGNLIC